ncbi:porin PorA family protein [Jiangella sp. DSM 45060]|uniref:porin PorA family protein n=1 Tax=Jiangella sp. DSM 45060 TaxID=1798224 RepID=UPI00087AAD9A|nr:porin PorA family protein [Jiangella sp. DSM 45060]SDS78601.1 Protein of unknown function [Jiangella sp. DSM 45060]
MRRSIGLVLVGLGVLMLVLAPLSRWYAYPRLAVVSNDVAERVSAGNAVTVLDLGAVVRQDAEIERVTDVRSVRRIIPDQGDSTGDTAVWDTSVTTFDEAGAGATPEENVLSYFEERVAFDRHTADSVDGHDQYYTPTGESADRVDVDHEGYYFKLPFGTEQRSYPFWDSTIQDTRPMEFQNETTLEGLTVYVFEQVVEPTPVSALEIPGALFGQAGSIVADRIYSNTRTIWVEPRTGAIIKGQEEQDSYLDFEGTRGPTIVQGTLAYTDAQVSANVDEYAPSADRLGLVRDTLPVAAAAAGLVFVVAGLLLARRGSYHGKRRSPGAEEDGPAGSAGGPTGFASGAEVAGVVARPAEERTPLQQRPRDPEPARSLFERPRYEAPQLSPYGGPRREPASSPHPYDDGQARFEQPPWSQDAAEQQFADQSFADPAAEPLPPEEPPAAYAEEPRLHFETAPGAGVAAAADHSAPFLHDEPRAYPDHASHTNHAGHDASRYADSGDPAVSRYAAPADHSGRPAYADPADAGAPQYADSADPAVSRYAAPADHTGRPAYADPADAGAPQYADSADPAVSRYAAPADHTGRPAYVDPADAGAPQYATPADDAGQFVQADHLSAEPLSPQSSDQDARQAAEQRSPLPRRRPQSGAVRPPVGRAQAQGQSAQSLLGQSPTSPLTPAQPHDDHAESAARNISAAGPATSADPALYAGHAESATHATAAGPATSAEPATSAGYATSAGHAASAGAATSAGQGDAGTSGGSAELEQARADLARLEQARAELARFAQEHPDLATEPTAPTPDPAGAAAHTATQAHPAAGPTGDATAGDAADHATAPATRPATDHPAADPDLVQPAAATPEPKPAAPAQGRRRARDDDALFDEFDEDGQSAGSLHRY